MNQRLQALKYISLDYFSAALAWLLFYRYRKTYLEPAKFGYEIPIDLNESFFLGLYFFVFCFYSR